eukprot:TRINITY_DN15360_c0_g1_i4.p1 TRINITY_DN15360_c0_g1~~TRINITY_DN15360_c0_g1_i4.p1  ORF type:complete len:520 (-),score=59.22 TRINITY_DN15360_c0_g1_i4:269-1828(-)
MGHARRTRRERSFRCTQYSYQTCGNAQTFAKWQFARNQSGAQLKQTTEAYARDVRATIEHHILDIASAESQGICARTIELGCNCTSCAENSAWTIQTKPYAQQFLDFGKAISIVSATKFMNDTDQSMQAYKCSSGLIGRSMRTVALREYNDVNRIAYIYYGSQSTGAMTMWPAMKWCPAAFDARMRPWYATAASGPKDVVIVLDRSGSMNKRGRWQAVQDGARKVLLTLGEEDFATVVVFSDVAASFDFKLQRVTEGKRAEMIAWINKQKPFGNTNFRSGLSLAARAFQRGDETDDSSHCTKVLLFLTDGEASDGFKAEHAAKISGLNGVTIMTYSFGTDIGDQQVLKKMACQNKGIWHSIPDGGDIATAMASYYQIFAASLDTSQARWVEYADAATGTPLVAACYNIYDRSTTVRALDGVVCVDLNVIISLREFKDRPDYDGAWAAMRAAATNCTVPVVSEMQLSAFRQLQGTDCRPCDFTEADCPTDAADEVSRASLLQPLTWSALLWILSAVVTPL